MTIDAPVEKVFIYENFKTNHATNNSDKQYSFKSTISNKHSSLSDWQEIKKATWIKPELEVHTNQYNTLFINDDISLKIPITNKELESVLLEGTYILELKDDWDDEGSVGYTLESWKAGAYFIINFNKWIKGIFSGSLHLPKMHHGPKGTIDIAWHEDNFRLFVNIDFDNNKGTFYSDTPKKQFSEGEFVLNDFKFHFLPIPFKY
jgi:hypothetical protein